MKNRIHIETLRIRVPRGSAADVRKIGVGLGREIMGSLAAAAKGRSGTVRLDELSVGKVDSSIGMEKIHAQVAVRVAAAVNKKLGSGGR